MHQRHSEMLSQATLNGDDLQNTSVTLRRLERFWIRAADLVQRTPPQFAPGNQTEAARAETGAVFGSRISSGH
jgi:hypothetical protein